MGLDHPSPVHMRPPESDHPPCGRLKWMAPKYAPVKMEFASVEKVVVGIPIVLGN